MKKRVRQCSRKNVVRYYLALADVKANYIEVFELGYQHIWSKEEASTKTWLVTPLSIYIINYCNFYYITNSFEVCIVLHSSISAVGSKEALEAINIVMFFRRKWCVRTEKTLSRCPALEHATHSGQQLKKNRPP